jgi:hypothetical protein
MSNTIKNDTTRTLKNFNGFILTLFFKKLEIIYRTNSFLVNKFISDDDIIIKTKKFVFNYKKVCMNKKVLLLMAFISMNLVLQVAPMSVENMHEEYNFWLDDFNEMQEEAIREITLSDSFANKQVVWYLMDAALHKEKKDFIEELVYDLIKKSHPNYRLNIEICSNKINFINKTLIQLDEAVLLIEEQFSIPSGQFKIQAIEFAENQDLESFAESFVPLSK